MWKTTYTTSLIRLASWTVVQGARYPDYNNPFMVDSNRFKNVVMPFWFTDLGIKRVEVILYNDDISRTASIVLDISIVRWSSTISLYTLTLASWVTTVVSTTTKTLQANDKLYITITSAPADCQSAFEVFFNYSNKETAWQFANNISVWFDQSIPKVPVWVIKEQATDRDNTPMCSPSYGTDNSWLLLDVWSDQLTVQRYDAQRKINIITATSDKIRDKTSVSLNCWSSTWIWWTATTAPSANISAMLTTSISSVNNVFMASRWVAANAVAGNDTFRLQRYSYSSSTKALTFVARSNAYRTMKTGRSWGWIFWLRNTLTWSFTNKVLAGTMLRQQAGVDSKIWGLLVFNQDCTLANTFQRIGNIDASLYGVYWPWYIYEEVSGGATTAITCIAHVTDTTSVVAPYPDKIACLWKYDNTWVITSQYDIRINSSWTAIVTSKWVSEYGGYAYIFGDITPDPVGSPTVTRPRLCKYDKDWTFIEEIILPVSEACNIMSVSVNSSFITYVVRNISDSKDVVMRYNLTTLWTELYKKFTNANIHYAKTLAYNKIFIHWFSTINSGSIYGYIYNPWTFNEARQPDNNFTISKQAQPSSYSNYLGALLWAWFSITQVSTNPVYTQALTTQALTGTTSSTTSNNTIFSSLS